MTRVSISLDKTATEYFEYFQSIVMQTTIYEKFQLSIVQSMRTKLHRPTFSDDRKVGASNLEVAQSRRTRVADEPTHTRVRARTCLHVYIICN